MNMILDIHTHCSTPNPLAIIDISAEVASSLKEWNPEGIYPEYQYFSVGIHPWNLKGDLPEGLMEAVKATARRPDVALIGETGIDILRGGPLFRQISVFKEMALLAEEVGKPLLIHDVKAHDIIIGMHRDLKPAQPWIIHGFRQKPDTAEMLLREGLLLSFGPMFNPVTIHTIDPRYILAESDDSGVQIPDVIHRLSEARGTDLTDVIAANTARVLSL